MPSPLGTHIRFASILRLPLHSFSSRTLQSAGFRSRTLHPQDFLESCTWIGPQPFICPPAIPAYSKEVIRPQVPLRPPCYDFSPLA